VPSVEEVRAAAATELPPSWLPRAVVVAERLPLLATGKVDRAALRDLAARQLAARRAGSGNGA
jgi:acyl-CoA synthetase (AMP-forming)/AMP-acid ligase II